MECNETRLHGNLMNLKERLEKYLDGRADVYCIKPSGGDNGNPNFVLCYRGRFIALRVNESKRRISLIARLTQNKIMRCGGWAFEVDSLDEVADILQKLSKEQEQR